MGPIFTFMKVSEKEAPVYVCYTATYKQLKE